MAKFFRAVWCLRIQSTSPHTLDSTLLIKSYHIIEENKNLVHFWESHRRFSKSFAIKFSHCILLANYWPIMNLFKMATFSRAVWCLGIKSTSPHTLDSTLLIKRYHTIEENKKFIYFWGGHRRFSKSFGIKFSHWVLLVNNWPIMDLFKMITLFGAI